MKKPLCLIGALVCGLVLTSAMMLVLPVTIRPAFADPGVLYVAPGGECGGASPCYSTVQAAVDAAVELDTIKVAAGTYTGVQNIPALNTSTFTATQVVAITKSVTIQGGYTPADWGTFDPGANITVLDAQGQGRVLVVATGGGDGGCTVDGLHITGGDATGLGGTWQGDTGGGVYVDHAAVVMKTNWVYDNTAYEGGGIYLYLGSASTLSYNSIFSNTAEGQGGGVYLHGGNTPVLLGNTLSSNTIVSNTANAGGGLYLAYSDATLINNTITGNHGDYAGGGLYVSSSIAKVTDNTIAANTAGTGGGGLYLQGSKGAPILIGNAIISNTAEHFGGGLEMQFTAGTFVRNIFAGNEAESQSGGGVYLVASHAAFTNNNIVDNRANLYGGGMYVNGYISVLVHTTFARNEIRNSGGNGSGVYVSSGDVVFTNTVLVSHTVGVYVTASSTATLEGTLWGSGAWANGADWGGPGTLFTGTVNVWGDPAFAGAGDYHLAASSAAIDVGVNAGVTEDIDGQVRPYGAEPDLGADERASSEASVSPGGGGHLMAVAGGLTTTVEIPAGAVTATTDFVYTAQAAPDYPDPPDQAFAGHAFELDAYGGGTLLPGFTFSVPVTITIHYADGEVAGMDEASLELQYWDGSAWQSASCRPHERHPDENWLGVPVCHLSEFALFGRERAVYLPLVLRSD